MINRIKKFSKHLIIFQFAIFCSYVSAHTVNTSVSVSDFTKVPALISASATPQVMLAMSNDHQQFFKLYTDWDDLDNDGEQDTTYKSTIEYYGYFDSNKCYNYNSSDRRFDPIEKTDANHYCVTTGQYFSGNFLNWSSMTRVDAIRKVLYGGLRSTDDDDLTILERSFLPTDAHSFAKHYESTPAEMVKLTPFNTREITLCNTTYNSDSGSDGESQNVKDPPLLRAAKGDYRYWAANERWQCTWDNERGDNGSGSNVTSSETSDPNQASDGLGEYIVKVKVCDSSLIEDNCKSYDDNGTRRLKPIGLLQTYGESGAVDFGLITGSYEKNKSGGVVRKNISSFSSEVNTNTGQFTYNEGIVSTLDKLRISRYGYSDDGRYNGPDSCAWGRSSFNDGDCSNWGNPFSEIYIEAVRYFAGLSKTPGFDADDTNYIDDLKDVSSWTDPLDVATRCASCNIVVINASDISYDNDALGIMGTLTGSPSATALTNAVGVLEGISGNDYYVGESGGANNQLCTAKTVTNFGEIEGTCPNAPRLEGTYNIAGVSHWAHTEDIRTDLGDIQKVNTYAIALAPSTPSVIIPVPGTDQTVTILPACRNTRFNPDGNCAIVDFKILGQDFAAGTGAIYINWEDSEQGGDFDQDLAGILVYKIASGMIEITTDVSGKSTPYEMGFAYVISGTTDDGYHVHSGINGFVYDEPAITNDCASGCSDHGAGGATSKVYTLGASSASLLNDPLWYAAKYGGFNDIDGDKNPNETGTEEWDLRDISGNIGSDGIPDNFFPVFNPSELEDRLNQVFKAILNRVSAGNAAAVVSKTSSGIGAVYQAIYQPLIKQASSEVSWAGFIHGIFIDSKGLLREDTDGDAILDGYSVDKIIEIEFNEAEDETQIQRYNTSDGGATTVADGLAVPLHQIKPIWSAQEAMSKIDNDVIKTNRAYDPTSNDNGRYMYTWIDDVSGTGTGTAGVVDDGEMVPFIASSFASGTTNYHYLNVEDPADAIDDGDDAGDIVNFVRGVTGIPNQRNRIIDYNGDNVADNLRIGDVIHSTPVAVGEPKDGYNTIYSDTTYRAFVSQYANRRQVIYVGGNDGVLHAFNSGFWDSSLNGFVTDLDDPTSTSALILGAELWGYVPMNILPHLKWLPEIDYPHVYFIDAEPLVFDAKIFDADSVHPNGWGTVLVVGMRLGGGDITLDIDGDDTIGSSGDITTKSAYIVMDITNPEEPPKLLAEITDDNLNFTTSRPDVVAIREPVDGDFNSGTNEWYLAFGSGPDDLSTVESSQTARAYLWDLSTKTFVANFDGTANSPTVNTDGTAVGNGYMGDFTVIDWDIDGKDDTIYYGTDETSTGTAGGRIQRISIDSTTVASSSITTMIEAGKALINKPLTVRQNTNRWLFMGSGRLFTTTDVKTTSQEVFYGIKDDTDYPSKTYTPSDLQEVTGVDVFTAGYVLDNNNVLTGEPSITDAKGFTWLESLIESKDGWFLNMKTSSEPSTRNLGNAISINKLLAYTLYAPTADLCNNIGSTTIRLTCLTTGTACPFDSLGTQTTLHGERVIDEVNFVSGLVTDISVHFDGKGNPTLIGHGQHGDIHKQAFSLPPIFYGRKTWREILDY